MSEAELTAEDLRARTRGREAAYRAFAGQPPDEAGVYELPSDRDPWTALVDALDAAMAEVSPEVERLRAELAERKANAEGICIDLEQWKARAQLAEAELSDLQERVQKLTATRIGDFRLVPATEILAALAAPETPGAKREGCDDPDCSRTECLHLGTCWEDAMDPPETPGDAETEGLVMSATHPPLVPVFGEMEPDPGCSDCGTCTLHDGCADAEHPIQDGDCETCGACRACIELCARMRETDPARTPGDAEESTDAPGAPVQVVMPETS